MNNNISLKLKEILRAADWTQEKLTRRLEIPLKTLNSWINKKAAPHKKNAEKVENLYLEIVGREKIDANLLANTEILALKKHLSVKEIIENDELLDKITLYLTYHTNNIEGSTMTLADVKEVLADDNRVLANKTAREQIEARNHRAALFYLLDELNSRKKNFKWNEGIILQTHLRLMNTLIANAGAFRNHGVRILGSHIATANYLKIPEKMQDLLKKMNAPTKNLLENLSRTHANFEKIHPFSDGNGRTGRLIMFISALQNEITPPLVAKERKRAYYKYLEIAQTEENYEPLRLFLAESVLFTDELIKIKSK